MNDDIYKKIAIETAVKANSKNPFGLVLTSSNSKVDCISVAEGLKKAFESIQLKTIIIDITNDKIKLKEAFEQIDNTKDFLKPNNLLTAKKADEVVAAAVSVYDVSIFVTKPLSQSDTAMLLSASCANVILTEQKNLSRTDMIENELEIINNLQAKPIGFILK